MNTRKLLITAFSILVLGTSSAFAQGIGVGGQLLSPTGVSIKAPIGEISAITGAVGFFVSDNFNNATIEANYILYRGSERFNVDSGSLRPYFGGGLSLGLAENSDATLSFRVPFGIEYGLESAPVEIYMDIGPDIGLTPNVDLSLDSSLGFRIFFGNKSE